MTFTTQYRRRISGDASERLARVITQRWTSRYWRRPHTLRHWADLPLFAHANTSAFRQRASDPAARHVQQLGVRHPSTARLIADLAGLCLEDER